MDIRQPGRLSESGSGEYYRENEHRQRRFEIPRQDSEELQTGPSQVPRTILTPDPVDIAAEYRSNPQSVHGSTYGTSPREDSNWTNPHRSTHSGARHLEDVERPGESTSVEHLTAGAFGGAQPLLTPNLQRARNQHGLGISHQNQEVTTIQQKKEELLAQEILNKKPVERGGEHLSQHGHGSAASDNTVTQQHGQNSSQHEMLHGHKAITPDTAGIAMRKQGDGLERHVQPEIPEHNQQDTRSLDKTDHDVQQATHLLEAEFDPVRAGPDMSVRRQSNSSDYPNQSEQDQNIREPQQMYPMHPADGNTSRRANHSQGATLNNTPKRIEREAERASKQFDIVVRPKPKAVSQTPMHEIGIGEARPKQNYSPSTPTMMPSGDTKRLEMSQIRGFSNVSESGECSASTDTDSTCDDESELDDVEHRILDLWELLKPLVFQMFLHLFGHFASESLRNHRGNQATQTGKEDEARDGDTRQGKGSTREARGRHQGRSSNQQGLNNKGRRIRKNKGSAGDSRDDEEDGDRTNEPSDLDDPQQAESRPTRRFACPFYKRNPQGPGLQRSCSGPGWDTIARLKEHLFRQHALPHQCERCGQEFKSELLLTQHRREQQACDVKEVIPRCDGVTEVQIQQLKSRKRTIHGTGNDSDKWYRIWGIIFGDYPPPPTPYYDGGETCACDRDILKEFLINMTTDVMEQRMRDEIAQRMTPPLEKTVSQRLPEIVHLVLQIIPHLYQGFSTRRFENQSFLHQLAQPDAAATDGPSSNLPSNSIVSFGDTETPQPFYYDVAQSMPPHSAMGHQPHANLVPEFSFETPWATSTDYLGSHTPHDSGVSGAENIFAGFGAKIPGPGHEHGYMGGLDPSVGMQDAATERSDL